MTRLITFVLFLLSWQSVFSQSPSSSEVLKYVISYKWGIVRKDAGEAILKMIPHGDKTELTLIAKTKPWADKFFKVRDTLRSVTSGRNFYPEIYEKIAHEGGAFSHDKINFSRNGTGVSATCNKYRVNKKGAVKESSFKMTAAGEVFDMLSVFYYLRNVDYISLQRGNPVSVSIFSGSDKAETVTIRFVKQETIEMSDKKRRRAYLLKLGFTSDGRKKSSDDIRVWVSVDGAHIPLLLVGSLPVGEVRVRLV